MAPYTILKFRDVLRPRTMRARVDSAIGLDAMLCNFAAAVLAGGCQYLNGTFNRIEYVRGTHLPQKVLS